MDTPLVHAENLHAKKHGWRVDSKCGRGGTKSSGTKFYQKMNFKKGFCDFIFLKEIT